MNAYEAKQEARRERLEANAASKRAEGAARIEAARAVGDAIPMGQPILVGHHSERRHRSAVERIDRSMRAGWQALDDAKEAQRRADAVGTGGISSDDPDAISKIDTEIAELEAQQARMKSENAAARKAGSDQPWPSYKITNNGANIRRLKARAEELRAKAADVTTRITVGDIEIFDSVEDNRTQIAFAGKPTASTVDELKANGFRWAPSLGVWQRMRSPRALWLAKKIAGVT